MLQGGKLRSLQTIPQPAETARLTSVSFRDQQLVCLWSTGLLQAYSTAHSTISGTAQLKLQTSRQLLGFASPAEHTLDSHLQQKPGPTMKSGKDTKSGKKRGKPAVSTDIAELANSASQPAPFKPMLVPLGGHSVAAVREPTDTPTNGHKTSGLDVTVVDTLYGCVQSVNTVKLARGATAAATGLQNGSETMQQGVLQLQSGMGDLILLLNNAVWSMSIQVSLA